MLNEQLSIHNSYYNDLAKTGAITYPELLSVPADFFTLFYANQFNTVNAQQKARHLVSDKASISKLEEIIN